MDDQESFDTHRKLHDNKPKNECVYCGKVLSTRGNLTVHMRIHVSFLHNILHVKNTFHPNRSNEISFDFHCRVHQTIFVISAVRNSFTELHLPSI